MKTRVACLAGTLFVAAACARATVPRPVALPGAGELDAAAIEWIDATFASLDLRHKIGQLVVPRISGSFLSAGSAEYQRVVYWIRDLGIGGLIETLGPPAEAALKLNMLQRMAAIPLLVAADMEEGPGQLLNGGVVLPYGLVNGGGTRFPPAMAIGATGDEVLSREQGRITAIEARAIGVHMNFAPVVDVNNNPDNPIINTRSFGADPDLVGRLAVAAVEGMQEAGLLATAKHFPGHGDTETDSHIALPVISANAAHVDSVELPPYRAAISAGVSGVMSAHIAFPALAGDSLPATLNPRILTGLLRDSLQFEGLIVTDALDMGAIVEGYGAAEAPVLAIEAGADLLLQIPADDVPMAIDALVDAVHTGRITESRIDRSVLRVLAAKAGLGLHRSRIVDLERLPGVIGTPDHRAAADRAAERSITVVRDRAGIVPLPADRSVLVIAYRGPMDPFAGRAFTEGLREHVRDVSMVAIQPDASDAEIRELLGSATDFDVVLFAPFTRVGAYRGLASVAPATVAAIREIAGDKPVVLVSFGSPYVVAEFPDAAVSVLAWGPLDVMQVAAARALTGASRMDGHLPVPLPPLYSIGEGITIEASTAGTRAVDPTAFAARRIAMPVADPASVGMDPRIGEAIDSLVASSIADGAAPGAAVAVGRHGRVVHMKGYGRLDSGDDARAVTDSSLFDLASLTKVVATTTAIMILVDRGAIELDAPIARYLPEWSRDDDGRRITVANLLRHDSGLPAFAPLWRELRGRAAYLERIARTPLEAAPGERMVYSDFGAILLGLIVERVSGRTLDAFVQDEVFAPLGMSETGYRPIEWRGSGTEPVSQRIAPTEIDTVFRMRHVEGEVHDENAYAMGGVAGHAGLFSSARDMANFATMMLASGTVEGTRVVESATVSLFTRRQSPASSRGLGWDTPSGQSSAGDWFSADSYGHTGFTGTSMWMDPQRDVFVVLLTNRVNPTRSNQRHSRLRRELADLVQLAIRDQPVERR